MGIEGEVWFAWCMLHRDDLQLSSPWLALSSTKQILLYCRVFNDPARGGGGVLSTPLFSSSLCTSCQRWRGNSRNQISLANFLKRSYSQIWGRIFQSVFQNDFFTLLLQPLDFKYLYLHSERNTALCAKRPYLDYWASSCAGAPGVRCEYGSK